MCDRYPGYHVSYDIVKKAGDVYDLMLQGRTDGQISLFWWKRQIDREQRWRVKHSSPRVAGEVAPLWAETRIARLSVDGSVMRDLVQSGCSLALKPFTSVAGAGTGSGHANDRVSQVSSVMSDIPST